MTPRRAIVTGVSVGIGRAIAARLASDGFEVHGTYLAHEREAHELAAGLSGLVLHRVDLAAADAVSWLVGPNATFVTGSDIVVDGGFGNVEPVLRREAGM
jgi:NAD(P)-dependent dehydrogenase (short-subunit alcohol dehydrogenase family)